MSNDTWTCEYCAKTYSDPQNYTNCRCAGMTAFRAGRSVPYSTTEHDLAATEARERGMAFIVDGKHVNADRVFILSVPDTIGPISDMRRAKIDAQAALKDMEAFAANVSKPMNKAHVAMTGQHIRQLLDTCGLEKKPHWDDTYLGMHSYIMMSDIEDRVRHMAAELGDARADVERIEWLQQQRETVGTGDQHVWRVKSEHKALRFAMDSQGALMPRAGVVIDGIVHGDTSIPGLNAVAPLPAGARWIDGILVTDPELAAPITDDIPGPASCACGVCGKLFSDDSGSLFCAEHR